MENIDFFLTQYANNPRELAKLIGAVQAATEMHAELSDIADLRSAIERMHDPTFDDMLQHFRRFLASDCIRKYFDQEAICSLNSTIYQPAGKMLNNEIMAGLQFIDEPRFSVAAAVVNPTSLAFKKYRNKDKPASIRMAAKDALFRFIKAGGVVITTYSCDEITDAHPANRNMQCRLERTLEVKDGDELVVRAGRDSISFESCESSVCFAQAYLKHSSASVTPEFDAGTMKLIGLSAANDVSSRIQLMTSVLRLFGHRDTFECCIPFTKHEDYYVRWYVMRELISMDTDRAWPIVKDMAENDPSQDVRRTATRTLEMFSNATVAGQ